MKKVTLLVFLFAMIVSGPAAVAQSGGGCVPDQSFIGFGIFPGPDTSELMDPPMPIFSDPTLGISTIGQSGQFFSFDFTAVIPDSLDAEPFIGVPLTVPLVSLEVLDVTGFDALGWTLADNVSCSQPGCVFTVNPPEPGDLTYECATVSGMLPTVTEQTDYDVTFSIEGVASLFGMDVPVALDYPDGEAFPGRYVIRVDPSTGVEDIISQQLSVSQNVPNPFSSITKITFNSTVSETYDFKVYNLVGGLVHAEKLEALVGENTVQFDAGSLSSGIYMYSFGNADGVITRRMMIEK
ncbi:MAG: T9SS type A sorting domain-containing protein [Bacteroidota bacterium]